VEGRAVRRGGSRQGSTTSIAVGDGGGRPQRMGGKVAVAEPGGGAGGTMLRRGVTASPGSGRGLIPGYGGGATVVERGRPGARQLGHCLGHKWSTVGAGEDRQPKAEGAEERWLRIGDGGDVTHGAGQWGSQ
jgi:hypothetical protein